MSQNAEEQFVPRFYLKLSSPGGVRGTLLPILLRIQMNRNVLELILQKSEAEYWISALDAS